MNKSPVSLEQHQCTVCFNLHDTGTVLVKKDMRPTLEHHTVTGRSMCPECQDQINKGFIALIEADEKTRKPTGNLAWLAKDAWASIFSVQLPPMGYCMTPPEVLATLRRIQAGAGVKEAFDQVAAGVKS